MPLSQAQIGYIRDAVGDDVADNDGDYLLNDATLQTIYADATQGNSGLDRTIVYALRRMVGKTARKFGRSGEYQNEQQQQWHEHLRDLLKEWEARAGVGGGTLAGGLLALRLDYTDDDVTADARED